MKSVPFFLLTLILAAPVIADAAETVTVSSNYTWERQALQFTKHPTVNLDSTFDFGRGFGADLWLDFGDKNAQELDAVVSKVWKVHSTDITLSGGGYFFPSFSPTSVVEVTTSTPVGGLTFATDVARYDGSYRNTLVAATIGGNVSLPAGRKLSVTVGPAYNTERHAATVFGRLSMPLSNGDKPVTIGLRGYAGKGSGFALDVSKTF
jgi:hypothetical protein